MRITKLPLVFHGLGEVKADPTRWVDWGVLFKVILLDALTALELRVDPIHYLILLVVTI